MKTGESPLVTEHRVRARLLLKTLRFGSGDAAAAAVTRFRRLRRYAEMTDAELAAVRDRVKLKHALTVIALENGHESWPSFKESLETGDWRPETSELPTGREMYARAMDVLLNRWFATYEEARASLAAQGGFLLPYEHQFFVTEEEGIRILGLDPQDPDWERIGWDWVKPRDREAWLRLRRKREARMHDHP